MAVAEAHVSIRPAIAADQRFVAATWFHSMLGGRNRAPRLRRRLNAQIDRVLDDATTRALVACKGERIVGWLVYSTTPVWRVVHYAYVRDDDRGHGICKRLIDAAWPANQTRLIATMRGPMTDRCLASFKNAMYIPLEEVLSR